MDRIEIGVCKLSCIVRLDVEMESVVHLVERALLDVPEGDVIGGQVIIHERGADKIDVPRYLSNLGAIIHIKRDTSPAGSD